ncbi:MAG: UDP-N-acetylmuramoyl-tripeptide--D-alanyl-D-alanine ligase, partial [Coxiellaceae bacterium]|nr:UDP-N-acetylmuramoyl-tripeptide--D-alanyl-D-alanine ligase [Coxiellaceae bacterium]
MELTDIVDVLDAKLVGSSVAFDAVSTDTRTIQKNNLFFALSGPNFDGHDYIETAKQKQAAAAVVSKEISCDLPQLKVDDTILALGRLAHYHRSQFTIPVIGITGSCGKTTTKTMLANIIKQTKNPLFTQGTMNNHIGLPLTLMRLNHEHDCAILEMGANAPGDIQYLCSIANPMITLVNNVAPAHLEGFGSIKGVAVAKSEIYQALPAEGIAVINADDRYADYMRSQAKTNNIIRFGIQNSADIVARNIQLNDACYPSFTLVTPVGEMEITLPIIGEHNVMNALAAAALAIAMGVNLLDIKNGIESLQPIDMRLVNRAGKKGAMIFDDTYNANPLSFDAALHVLSMTKGRKFLVFGDMGELGENARQFHHEIGFKAKNLGVNRLFTVG